MPELNQDSKNPSSPRYLDPDPLGLFIKHLAQSVYWRVGGYLQGVSSPSSETDLLDHWMCGLLAGVSAAGS